MSVAAIEARSSLCVSWMLPSVDNILICIDKCTSLTELKQLHAQVFLSGLQYENYVAVKLISFCSKTLGNFGYARKIFDSLICSANVFLWTAMITSYSNHSSKAVREAILIYRMMHRRGHHPNNFTLSSVLKACSFLRSIHEGKQIHAHSTKLGFNSSNYVHTTLVDMYAKLGSIQEAAHLFGAMSEENVVVCNSMIVCYANAGDLEAAQQIFNKMSHRDSVSWTSMISGYARHRNIIAARMLLNQMPERTVHSWNAAIAACSHAGEWNKSIEFFSEMRLDFMEPNHFTMTTLMSACSQLGSLDIARQVHGLLQKNFVEMNVYVYNSLVDMYAKCGNIHEAYSTFSKMPIKDVVSYNVMILCFANHGHGDKALQLFFNMLDGEVKPDGITFLGILTACSQSGFLDVGRQYFACMRRDYGVEPSADHYACMVDLFGRAGFIEEAYNLIRTMPVEPHAGVWGALLNACSTYGHVEVGEIAAWQLFRMEPENPGNYVLLSNIYAKHLLWDGVKEVRCLMRARAVAKAAGFSWVEVNSEIHEFLMGDATHPRWEEINAALGHLSLQLA